MPIVRGWLDNDYARVNQSFGAMLRAAREAARLTQLQAGLAIRSDGNSWSRYERGHGSPDPEKLALILAALPALDNDEFLATWARTKMAETAARRGASSPPEGPAGRPRFAETAPPPKDATRRSA